MGLVDGKVKACLELFLEEDVEFSLESVLLFLSDLLGTTLLLDLLNTKSHDSLLKSILELLVLGSLSELCQEGPSSLFSKQLLLFG